jgi:signal transduction histidine kinase/DNA-binding response OmpR family regulator
MKSNANLSSEAFDHAELRSLIDRNADGILVVDETGLVRFANEAALTLFGRSRKGLLGHRLGLPFAAGETTSIDLIRPDGTSLEAEMRVAETIWDGAPALLASLRDISERRQLEEQLRHAQKMEAVGRLTAGVAHDFNNLLTIVLGNLDTLQRRLASDTTDPRLTRSITNATAGARRAADLTHQLLAYSRRQPLKPKAVDLSRLLADMAELLNRTLGAAISIDFDVAPGTWPIMVDPSQLEAALINLAVNAKDAMGGGGSLSIHARNCTASDVAEIAPGQFVCLSVRDSGDGIPDELKERVFDPFFTTKGVGKGTGLGLSQVYGFVKQSLGHVKLDSAVGAGTVVRLYLPRHHGEVDPAVDQVTAQPTANVSRTILLVEDEEQLRDWTRHVLEDLGFEVLEASTGAEALAILESDQPLRLMFTDVSLPGKLDGRQLTTRAASLRPAMKTLITTAYAADLLVENGRLAAGIHLLSKPYSRDQLLAALDALDCRPPPLALLIEDDTDVSQTLAEALREAGYVVEIASTATSALKRIRDCQRPISAAVIDVELPDGSGLALVDALREEHPKAAAVVATGSVEDQEVGIGNIGDGVAYLNKPFSGEELRRVLERLHREAGL